jgi:hypothetical protein
VNEGLRRRSLGSTATVDQPAQHLDLTAKHERFNITSCCARTPEAAAIPSV